jgi:hypothetical protein
MGVTGTVRVVTSYSTVHNNNNEPTILYSVISVTVQY